MPPVQEFLSVRLFRRSVRRVEITGYGRDLYAALADIGIAPVESRFVAEELSTGQLINICNAEMLDIGYYTGTVINSSREQDAQAFLGWVREVTEEELARVEEAIGAPSS